MTKAQNTGFINLDFYLYITFLNNQHRAVQTINTVFFLSKTRLFVVVRSVGYLRATARVPTVFLPPLTPRINGFSFEKPLSSNKVPLPCASGVFDFYGNMRCGINGFMPQGFEARSVV